MILVVIHYFPDLEYAAPIWGGLPKYLEDEIQHVKTDALTSLGNLLH